MLLPAATLDGVRAGRVTVAFRRWDRPRVRAGGRQRTRIGVIGFEAVEPVTRDELTEEDARSAGLPDLQTLLRFLDRRAGTIYRIRLAYVGPDPRVALRESLPDEREIEELERRLARLDRSSHHGPWTHDVLAAIGQRPGTPALELATSFGRAKLAFKADVRKLKELGLTESLRPGYRVSPRGRALLDRMGSADRAPAEQPVNEGVDG